jgi:hypothetical protein
MQTDDPDKNFQFTLDEEGRFIYDDPKKDPPDKTWDYRHGDLIRFQTNAGPFKIDFRPTSGVVDRKFNPLGGPLKSRKSAGGLHIAETTARDKFTDSERETIVKAHIDAKRPKGFITAYDYVLDVTDANGQPRHDDQKNGTFGC